MNRLALNQVIYEQIYLPENAAVVDLGCRDAGYLNGLIQKFAGKISKAIGVDITDKNFNRISYNRPVELRVMDCAGKLNFPDGEFDLVLIKDLLECVSDKKTFVEEVYRILKPAGMVICVNCDYDSIIYNGADKDLITKAVHAYAITKQDWMDDIDSWMGRRTYSVFNAGGLFESSVSVYNIVETEYKEESFGYEFSRDIEWLAEKDTGMLSANEYCCFIDELKTAYKKGEYIFSKPYYIYKGIKR